MAVGRWWVDVCMYVYLEGTRTHHSLPSFVPITCFLALLSLVPSDRMGATRGVFSTRGGVLGLRLRLCRIGLYLSYSSRFPPLM